MATTTSDYTIEAAQTGWQIRKDATELYDHVYSRHADAVAAVSDFARQDAEEPDAVDQADAIEALRDELREDVSGLMGLIDGLDDLVSLRKLRSALHQVQV